MSILYIGFTGWRQPLRRSFYRPLFGGIPLPLPPLTWSPSPWQGEASYRSVVPLLLAGREVKLQKGGPLPPRWEACHRHEKRADSFRSFSLPSISRSGAVVIIPVALTVSTAAVASAVAAVTGVPAHGLPWARAPAIPAAVTVIGKYTVAAKRNQTSSSQGNNQGAFLHGIIPLSL